MRSVCCPDSLANCPPLSPEKTRPVPPGRFRRVGASLGEGSLGCVRRGGDGGQGHQTGDSVRRIAQLEGSARPLPDRWLAVEPLLAQVLADAQLLSAGRHRIEMAAQPDCEVAGIQSELASAIGNLVTNAIRYTPAGGAIEMAWRIREQDGCAEFEVRDTGIGIGREHLPRLTERFYRVDGSRSRETGGTGLGLTIVKHVAQRHGGELDMQSELGRGSRFKLVLPAARVRLTAARVAATHFNVNGAGPASSPRGQSAA